MVLFGRRPNTGTRPGFFARFRRPVAPNRRASPVQVAKMNVAVAQRNLNEANNKKKLVSSISKHLNKSYTPSNLKSLANAINSNNNSNTKKKAMIKSTLFRLRQEAAAYGPGGGRAQANVNGAKQLAKVLSNAYNYTY